jgi:hypothetical protein
MGGLSVSCAIGDLASIGYFRHCQKKVRHGTPSSVVSQATRIIAVHLVHGVKRGFCGVLAICAVERNMSCTILVILG